MYEQKAHGWARFVSMQSYYNLLNREEERETFPAMAALAMPWSPLARGKLTRDWDAQTARSGTDEMQGDL